MEIYQVSSLNSLVKEYQKNIDSVNLKIGDLKHQRKISTCEKEKISLSFKIKGYQNLKGELLKTKTYIEQYYIRQSGIKQWI